MKKTAIYIIIVLVLVATISGGTYAFFSASTNSKTNSINSASSKFEVIFTGGTAIDGALSLSSDRSGGLNTTVNIKMGEGSVVAKGIIYMKVETLTSALAVDGFVWEVDGYKGGELVYYNTGTFNGVSEGDEINIVEDYELSTDNTAFTVYLWLDGNMVSNEVLGARVKGFLGAKTENFTAEL